MNYLFKQTYEVLQNLIDYIETHVFNKIGAAGGLATLNEDGKVPNSQIGIEQMTQAEASEGVVEDGRLISPKVLATTIDEKVSPVAGEVEALDERTDNIRRVTDNKMNLISDDNTDCGPWRSLSKGNYPSKNDGLEIVEIDGITTISVLLSESGVRFSLPIRELSKGRYRLEFDYSAVDGGGNVIELSATQRLYGGNNNTQYAASGTAPFISDIEFVETFDNNVGHYYYEFEKTEETPTYFYRSIYVNNRWLVGNVITITNMKFVRLIDDISDWYKDTNDDIEKLKSESSSLTPSLVSGMLKVAADNPDGAFKYVSVVPSADKTYNALYRTSLSRQFATGGDYLKRLTYYPEFIVCGGQDVTIKYTGLNGIAVFELPYRTLGTSPIDSFANREIIKQTFLPSNQSEEFTGEVTISLSRNCRRLAFVLGSTQNVPVTPSEIINNITEVTLPVPDLENLSFGAEYQHDSIINAVRQARFVKYTGARPSIGLLHYTDLHGDNVSAAQIHKYAKILEPFTNDIICTGDVVHYYAEGTSSYPQGADWWKNSGLPEKSLFVLGNHDLATPEATEYSPKEGSAAWDGMGKEWGYENFFSPYINGLGITMPTGNDDESSPYYHSCYWHKDYTTAKVRLIGIDCIHRFDGIINPETGEILTSGERKLTAEQEIWLIEKLNETLDSENAAYGYHVMIICHYPLDDFSGDNKEWNDIEHEFDYNHKSTGGRVMNGRTNDVTSFHWKGTKNYAAENRFSMRGRGTNESKANNNVGEIIKAWMENGGKFIAWVAGHRHADSFWYPTKYPEILSVALDQAGWLRGGGTSSRYVSIVSESYRLCANFYSIDTENGLFKIVRVGQNMDKLMNVINYLCYDYINKKVISEG